jgi:hypothetical protein
MLQRLLGGRWALSALSREVVGLRLEPPRSRQSQLVFRVVKTLDRFS